MMKSGNVPLVATNVILLYIRLLSGQRLQSSNPCNSPSAIDLPRDQKCLDPIFVSTDWIGAQYICERRGGTLFQLPQNRIEFNEALANCLVSNPTLRNVDMWVNALGMWFQHWSWMDGTLVNPVAYCSPSAPYFDPKLTSISKNTLSVDYCVWLCRSQGAAYTILHNTLYTPECYCVKELLEEFRTPCQVQYFLFSDRNNFYIVDSTNNSNLQTVIDTVPPSSLCAAVNSTDLLGISCFERLPFVCVISVDQCPITNQPCSESDNECSFRGGNGACLLRVLLPLTWYAARDYCGSRGGDVWKTDKTAIGGEVFSYLDGSTLVWSRATNTGWSFDLDSSRFPLQNSLLLSCGFLRYSASQKTWDVVPEDCSAEKTFICQYNKTSNFSNESLEATCSWMNEVNEVTLCPIETEATRDVSSTVPSTSQGVILLDEYGINPDDPCSSLSAIQLPRENRCLIPVVNAYTWVESQRACERNRGTLYQISNARLDSQPALMNCLASIQDKRLTDLWLNAVGVWFQHWYWINGTFVNPVNYCSRLQPPILDQRPIVSNYLSVEYCISTCHDSGRRFIVFHNTGASPSCYCLSELDRQYMIPCNLDFFNFNDKEQFYIVHSQPDSLINVGGNDGFSSSVPLCATVNSRTQVELEIKSNTCFTTLPFICCLGDASKCVNKSCPDGTECHFVLNEKCMLRVSLQFTWNEARGYCLNRGGDLWNMHAISEMGQVGQYIDENSRYWIGATNYVWTFKANSTSLNNLNPDYQQFSCGHMFREGAPPQFQPKWNWGETVCDQAKSFICQFERTSGYDPSLQNQAVDCPWDIIATPVPPVPVTGDFVDTTTRNTDDDSFPYAALISGLVAGLLLLTCLALAAGFCGRRRWRAKKNAETVAFVPYIAENPSVIGVTDYDSHMKSNMSSVSEHGSQLGLVKGGYSNAVMNSYALSNSYGENTAMFLNPGQLGERTFDRKQMSEHQMNSSMDERQYSAATYNTMSSRAKEYMTLQAQMSIQDDAELSRMGSLRGKPEVTLVTDNVDMNFTVNHAVTTGNEYDISRSPLERTLEEITVPATEGGVALNLPERVSEAKIISMTSHMN